MARLTQAKYDERREEIIKEGMFLFLGQGYHATGIKETAEACGIHKGSFFNFSPPRKSSPVKQLDTVVRIWAGCIKKS